MRNLSLRDIKLADTLSHMSEVQIINPANDIIVKKVLAEIGFNVKQAIHYIPSYHRDMQGNKAVGFQVLGEYNVDPKYNKFIDTVDRVVVAGLTDIHLARDMETLLGKRFIYKNNDEMPNSKNKEDDPRYYSPSELKALGYTGMESDGDDEDFYEEYGGVESDYEMISSQIEALTALRISIRGE